MWKPPHEPDPKIEEQRYRSEQVFHGARQVVMEKGVPPDVALTAEMDAAVKAALIALGPKQTLVWLEQAKQFVITISASQGEA